MTGLLVDLFAGGGGASTGIEAALGRSVDVAINHDPVALAVHRANHPGTRHLDADIWEVKPREATGGAPVELLWASPDCTHFSLAKGDVPKSQNIRSLAWVVVRWAKEVRPSVILLENVSEFQGWGPLGKDGRPDKSRMGETFVRWKRALERLGYRVDYRVLDASLYGAPTKRRRLFLVARCDGQEIRWPRPTHGPGLLPLHTAAECIDWSLPCPSIFERKRPLAEKTLWRIAQGIRRFVLENPRPFVVGVGGRAGQSHATPAEAPLGTVTAKNDRALVTPHVVKVNHGKREARGESLEGPLSTVTATQRGHALVAPTLVQTGYGEREGQAPRALNLQEPLGTVVAGGQKHALVAAFLAKHFGGVVGQQLEIPLGTVTSRDHHSLAAVALAKFRGTDPSQLEGSDYQIVDIGMRMLEPHELLRAQFGRFAETYDLSAATTKSARVRLIGNSVCPEVAEALVRANFAEALRERAA